MSEQVDLTTIPISPEGGNKADGAKTEDGETVTVFHDKDNFNVKHPLSNRWTLWFTKPASGRVCPAGPLPRHGRFVLTAPQGDNWNELLKEVITFESVEEFWGVYVCASNSVLNHPQRVLTPENRTILPLFPSSP